MMKRRRFLTMMGASVASGAVGAGCSGSDEPEDARIPVAGTNVRDVPVGFLGTTGTRMLLGRDAGGLYAMTSVCTHNQCDLTVYGTLSASGISCKCHGSGFSRTGAAIRGPAFNPLNHFRVDVAPDGAITVDSKTIVDAAVRTPVT
jgi:nitrite reductase/ring-hydroxylating ferredoxin subunit